MTKEFKTGLKDGLPIALGYLSVSFAFGIYAVSSGFSVLQATLYSFFNVTSAGQMAGVPIIAAAGAFIELISVQFILNLRYSLMSVTLSQHMAPEMNTPRRMLFSFVITDEVFAVAASRKTQLVKDYLYGLILLPWLGWTLGTLIGAAAGNILPVVLTSALSLAIYGMFVAIVLPEAREDKAVAVCSLLAVVLSCLFYYVPGLNKVSGGFVIIICAVLASTIMAIAAPVAPEEELPAAGTDESAASGEKEADHA